MPCPATRPPAPALPPHPATPSNAEVRFASPTAAAPTPRANGPTPPQGLHHPNPPTETDGLATSLAPAGTPTLTAATDPVLAASATTPTLPPTTTFTRGNLAPVEFPVAEASGVKLRPAPVISTRAYQRARREVAIAAVTSNAARQSPSDLPLMNGRGAAPHSPPIGRPHCCIPTRKYRAPSFFV